MGLLFHPLPKGGIHVSSANTMGMFVWKSQSTMYELVGGSEVSSSYPTDFREQGAGPREEPHAQCHIASQRPSWKPAFLVPFLPQEQTAPSQALRGWPPLQCPTSPLPGYVTSPMGGLVPFLQVFGTMEQAKKDYKLEDYSINQVSLEDIFLSFTSPGSSTKAKQGQAVLASPLPPSRSKAV